MKPFIKRKIIASVAISLDGYLADVDGGYEWIKGDGNLALNTPDQWDYNSFLKDIDIVVMGKNCYDQQLHLDFANHQLLVATSKLQGKQDNITFINGDIVSQVVELSNQPGKDIFLFGGGLLIDQFIKADRVDEYIIGIIPVILGKGRPFFMQDNPCLELKLEKYTIDQGIVVLHYSRR